MYLVEGLQDDREVLVKASTVCTHLETMENFGHLELPSLSHPIPTRSMQAYESGFNSRTVFNAFFKKMEGVTPKAWVKRQVQ
jgi:AraC-like DNA-binding protein